MMELWCSLLLLTHFSLTIHSVTVYVCTAQSDSRDRLVRTAEEFNYNVVLLEKFSVTAIKTRLKGRDSEMAVIIATSNAVLNLPASELPATTGHVLVAGTASCSPKHLLSSYGVKDKNSFKPYVDSSVMIGQSDKLFELFSHLKDDDDIQNKLSEWYVGDSHDIVIDNMANVVYNVDSHANRVSMEFEDTSNKLTTPKGSPVIVKSIGTSDGLKFLNEVANYVGNGITRTKCNICNKDKIEFSRDEDYPTVLIGILFEKNVPFVRSVLKSLTNLQYPKDKITLLIVSLIESNSHAKQLYDWSQSHHGYNDLDFVDKAFEEEDVDIRHTMLSRFVKSNADFYLFLDSEVQFKPSGLLDLIMMNKTVISPLVTLNNGTAWSNFWGGYDSTWSYKRSSDYANIFHRSVTGLWTVPCIRNVYLMRRDLALYVHPLELYDNDLDPELSFCRTLVENRRFMWLTNEVEFGWLKQPQNESEALIPDIALREKYPRDWNNTFLIENVTEFEAVPSCPHVWRKQLFSSSFTKAIIEEGESIKKWKRVDTFVPAMNLGRSVINDSVVASLRDHTTLPVQELFPGYSPKGSWYDGFIFKVSPGSLEKVRLNHRHLAAYHALVPLNQPSQSLSNAGYNFSRYNCSITDVKEGQLYLFPGRVTHTKTDIHPDSGVFYYLEVSFDPPIDY